MHELIIHKKRATGLCPDCLELVDECVCEGDWYEKRGLHVMMPTSKGSRREPFDQAVWDHVIQRICWRLEDAVDSIVDDETFWERT